MIPVKRLLILVLLLIAQVSAATATTQDDRITAISYVEDPSGRMTPVQVLSQDFTPMGSDLAAGYTPSAIWFRIEVTRQPGDGELALVVSPSMLDDVTLHERTDLGWVTRAVGGRHDVSNNGWFSSLRGFVITPQAPKSIYLVRVQTSGSLYASFIALPRNDAARRGVATDVVQIFYLTLMFSLLLWAVRHAIVVKEAVFYRLAILQGIWLLHNLLYFGYLSILLPDLPPELVSRSYRFSVLMVTFATMLFHRSIMAPFTPKWYFLALFDLQIIAVILSVILFFAEGTQAALRINAGVILMTPFVLLLNAFTTSTNASPGIFKLRLIYGLLSVTLLAWVFALIGVNVTSFFALHGTIVHGSVTGLFMFVMLSLHLRNLMTAAKEAQRTLIVLEERQAMEREVMDAQRHFMAMLSHETRNALAVINMSLSSDTLTDRKRRHIAGAIGAIDALIDRYNQSVQLDSNVVTINRQITALGPILRDICCVGPAADRIDLQIHSPLQVHTDPVLLRVVMGNLVENAVKYSAPGSRVQIVLKPDDRGGATVTIENDPGNAGLPDPQRVFTKYYRHTGAQSQRGSGLGLYVVLGLVKLLGGQIAYLPENGRVRFQTWLPCSTSS